MKKFVALLFFLIFTVFAHEFDFSDLVKEQSDSVVKGIIPLSRIVSK